MLQGSDADSLDLEAALALFDFPRRLVRGEGDGDGIGMGKGVG